MKVPPHWDRTDVKALEGVVLVIGGVDFAGTVAPFTTCCARGASSMCRGKYKSPESRRFHRGERFSRYFQKAREVKVHWPDLAIVPRPAFTLHRLVAFEGREGFVRGQGIVTHVEEKAQDVVIRTPLLSFKRVDAVIVGNPEVDPNSFSDSITSVCA